MPTTAPYGTWESPIAAEKLVEQAVGLVDVVLADDCVYWVELRPAEAGRMVIVRRDPDGSARDVFGEDFSARTLVHEYGGRCFTVHDGDVYFSNLADQRIYRIADGAAPEPVTAEPPEERSVRFAAPVVAPAGRHLYCVRETHGPSGKATDVVNEIVVLPADGLGEPRVVASGRDFYSHPTLSPDGGRLAWTCWDHPRMPWDGTELWEAELGADGLPIDPRLVAGGLEESVTQPKYSPDGVLHFASDRTGWWNLYADDGRGGRHLVARDADFADPDWVFGLSNYDFMPDGRIVAVWQEDAFDRLAVIRRADDGTYALEPVPLPFIVIGYVRARSTSVVARVASPTQASRLVEIEIPSGSHDVLRLSQEEVVPVEHLSVAEPIEFPTEGGLSAYALLFRPHNPDYEAGEGELPPLIVASHGGPTGSADPSLIYGRQYWTSRGFAIVDVNYGGSSGYGRAYRQRLRGKWGIVDLDDCVNAAKHLVAQGLADPNRLLIRGGSAGGYTTLCALTFRDDFAAGASHFGVSDLSGLAKHTHKFESRYLDGLIGPWPEAEEVYRERSPIFHTELLRTPMILLQGLEDRVVPPEQAELMVAALRSKGVPFAY